jgi:hypothetical protein
MNRQQRRAAEAAQRARKGRSDTIAATSSFFAGMDDPTVTGGTLFLPSGECVFINAQTARAMAAADAAGMVKQ